MCIATWTYYDVPYCYLSHFQVMVVSYQNIDSIQVILNKKNTSYLHIYRENIIKDSIKSVTMSLHCDNKHITTVAEL